MALEAAGDLYALKCSMPHHFLQTPHRIHFGDFTVGHWLEGGAKNGLDSSEREADNLTDVVKTEKTAALEKVLSALTGLLNEYKSGLRIKKVQDFLLLRHGIDLQEFCVAQGYRDMLEFLDHHMPQLDIRGRENSVGFVVQLPEDISAPPISAVAENLMESLACQAPALIRDILESHPHGLKMKKLSEVLKTKYGFDLESFCCVLGYNSVESYLQDIPGLFRTRNCVIRLRPRSPSPAPSLDTDFSACYSNGAHEELTTKDSGAASTTPALDSDVSAGSWNAVSQKKIAKKPDLGSSFIPVLNVLQNHPHGLNLKELKENLKKKHGFDLDAASQQLGYGHVVAFLLNVPGLSFTFTSGKWPCNCVVRLLLDRNGIPSLTLSGGPSLDKFPSSSGSDILPQPLMETQPVSHALPPPGTTSSLDSEKFASKSETPDENMLGKKPAACASASSQCSTSLSENKEEPTVTSKKCNQNELGKKAAELTEVLQLLTNLLSRHKCGLRVKKVQEILLTTEKIDLEQYSIALDYKDSLEFLEHRMPDLKIKHRENRAKCVVRIGSGPDAIPSVSDAPVPLLKPTKPNKLPDSAPVNSAHDSGAMCKPSFTVQESLSCKSKIPSLPALTTLAAPAIGNRPPTSLPLPSVMHPTPPSLLHSHGVLSTNQKNFSQPLSSIPSQQSSAYQSNGSLSAKKAPGLSDVQPSKDLVELKQQVSLILSRYPEGMSLFQFRAAYSAAYQQHLPLGNASSAKQRLMQMPDVVTLLGCGVQTLLLPASSQPLTVKSDQPVSCKLENASLIPSCPLPISPAVTKPTSVVKPSSVSWIPGMSQPHTICPLSSDPLSHLLKAKENTSSKQEHGNTRAILEDHAIKPGLPKIKHTEAVLGQPLPKNVAVVVPEPCLRPADPTAAVLSGPWPSLSSLRSSEFPVQKALKPLGSVPELVRTRPKPVDNSQCPVVHPGASQTRRWAEVVKSNNLKSSTTVPANSWHFSSSTSGSHFQPVSGSSSTWNQPVVHPSLPVFSLHPAAFLPVSGKPSEIQFSNTAMYTCRDIWPTPQISPAKEVSSIQIPEKVNCVHTVPEQNSFSQGHKVSQTLGFPTSLTPVQSVRQHPVSSPPQNISSFHPPRSKIFNGSEGDQCIRLDTLPHHSFSDKSLVRGVSSSKVSSEFPASTQQKRNSDGSYSATSTSKLSLLSQSAHTNTAQQSVYPSFPVSSDPTLLHSESGTIRYQKYTDVDSTITASSTKPANLLPSPPCSPTIPSWQPLYASSHISNQSSATSQSWNYVHQKRDAQVSPVKMITDPKLTTLPSSPFGTPPTLSRQPSFHSRVDYGASNGAGLLDSSPLFSPPPLNNFPNKMSEKCVIL